MNRITYETVEVKVWELTLKMGKSDNEKEQFTIIDQISDYIKACGWSEKEFDEETLRRIDNNWNNESSN